MTGERDGTAFVHQHWKRQPAPDSSGCILRLA
jgi:hypothetical protein